MLKVFVVLVLLGVVMEIIYGVGALFKFGGKDNSRVWEMLLIGGMLSLMFACLFLFVFMIILFMI